MKLLNAAKKITTAAALAAALLAGTAPKAAAANVDRTPGSLGLYIMPATVTQYATFPNHPGRVWIIFTDADGEGWTATDDFAGGLPEIGRVVTLVMDANGTPDDFTDDQIDGVLWCDCTEED